MRYLLTAVSASSDSPPRTPRRNRARDRLRWLMVALGGALVALSGWHLVQLGRLMGSRIRYPMDLEWMEGGQLYQAYRLLHGLPLYGDCSDGYLPFAYPPGHAIAVAAAGAIGGLDYPVARLVSVGAFTLCMAVLAREVWRTARTSGQRLALPLLAAGAMAATYPSAGDWYDVVRVDSLYLGLLMAGAATVVPAGPGAATARRLSWRRAALAAALLGAAIYTKQTAALFVPWICLFVMSRDRRSGAKLIVALAALTALPFAWLELGTHGRFGLMVLGVMSHHPLVGWQALAHALRLLVVAPYLPIVLLLGGWLWRRRHLRTRTAFWLGMLLSAVVVSLLTSAKVGAFANNLASAMLIAPVAALMLFAELQPPAPRRLRSRSLAAVLAAAGAVALLFQQTYDIRPHIPSPRRFAAARAFNDFIASLEGGVIIPAHAFLAVRNGQQSVQFHEQAYVDIMGAGASWIDPVECLSSIDARWLIVNRPHNVYLQRLLDTAYEYRRILPQRIRTSVGLYTSATMLFERRQGDPLGVRRLRRHTLFDFEAAAYPGWRRTGEAFSQGPTTFLPGYQQPIGGQRGRRLANSFHPKLGDTVVGELISPPFVIDRDRLGFRAGGGRASSLQVVLEVDGERVRRERGPGRRQEVLLPFVWDVSVYRGTRARLILVDQAEGPWGHLLVDAVELFDVTPGGDGQR